MQLGKVLKLNMKCQNVSTNRCLVKTVLTVLTLFAV